MTKEQQFIENILAMAKEDGAETPTIDLSNFDQPIVVDTASGKTWEVKLREF